MSSLFHVLAILYVQWRQTDGRTTSYRRAVIMWTFFLKLTKIATGKLQIRRFFWCNGYGVGLVFDRSRVRFPAAPLSRSNLGQVVHTHVPLSPSSTIWYRPKGGKCSAAGKVTVGLASHWPCVTDFSGLSTYGLKGYEREMSTPPTLRRGMVDFTFLLRLDVSSIQSNPSLFLCMFR